jgi:type IV pilus assembly protein PilB
MVLVTGPTGLGKTTTLYSALAKINTGDVNIMTAEDPVEYNLSGSTRCRCAPRWG